MAFRVETFEELCSTCKEPAATRCPRCGRPVCADHAPDEERRCSECEAFWAEVGPDENPLGRWGKSSNALVKGAKWSAEVACVGFVLVLIGLSGVPSLAILGGLLVLGFPLAAGLVAGVPIARLAERSRDRLRHKVARRRFLAERKRRALPPSEARDDASGE